MKKSKKAISTKDLCKITLFLFYSFSTLYSLYVFVQFTEMQIFLVSGTFLLILFLFIGIFLKSRIGKIKFSSWWSVVLAFPVSAFLFLLLLSQLDNFHHGFNVYPLFEADSLVFGARILRFIRQSFKV